MVAVPRAWPGETVVCLATGPSLTQADVDYCRGKARVIAVNDAYTLAPWADALYACDARWWQWHGGVPEFTGAKWSMEHSAWSNRASRKFAEVQRLRNAGPAGLSRDPSGLKNGRNSGYQAVNLAFLYGASLIVLLGYDMTRWQGKSHFFGEHPHAQAAPPFDQFLRVFPTIVKPLAKSGVTLVNATRRTILQGVPRVALEDALTRDVEAVA